MPIGYDPQLGFSLQDSVCILDEISGNTSATRPGEEPLESWILQETENTQRSLHLFKEIIETQLKIRNHVANNHEETDICAICQTEYEGREIIAALNCGHEYHSDCIKDWLVVKNVCPLCKSTAIDY